MEENKRVLRKRKTEYSAVAGTSRYFKNSQVKQSKKKENLKVTCDESKKEDEVSENTSGSTTHMGNLNRLTFSFFDQDCTHLAKALLGKVIVRNCKNSILRAMIVETEAYLGGDDKASHSYGGKKTKRNAAMFMPPGEGAAVLIRAVEATEGKDIMMKNRTSARKSNSKPLKDKEVGNGPSKLTQALDITKAQHDQQDLVINPDLWLENDIAVQDSDIVHSTRVGVDYAGEWALKPLRFYIRDNVNVSVRDKDAEKVVESETQ